MRYLIAIAALAFTACQGETAAYQAPSIDLPQEITGYIGVTGQVDVIEDMTSEYVTPRNVEIWLPPSYATSPNKRYPVIYMHDGQNLFDPAQSQYSGIDWGVDEAMTRLIADSKIREAIIVGPWSTEARNPEYFPQKAAFEYSDRFFAEFPEFDATEINSDGYLKYLVEELKPFIDSRYRTLPDRANTFTMGSSMGGLTSIYAISEYPEVFGGAGCVSTHFPMGDGAIVDYFDGKLPDPKTHKIYFDYGTETLDHNYEGYQDRMDALMIKAGYKDGENWMTRKFPGHEHSEKAWRARVHIPLQFLLADEYVDGGEE